MLVKEMGLSEKLVFLHGAKISKLFNQADILKHFAICVPAYPFLNCNFSFLTILCKRLLISVMFKNFFSIVPFAVFLLAGCANNETNLKKKIDPEAIYFDYRVWG